MKNNHWMKMITSLLLALLLLAGSLLGALAEGADAAVVADLTAEEEAEPVLLASVNGDEIWSNNEDMQELINYYLSYYSSYGYDTNDESLQAYLQAAGLHWAIEGILYQQKAAELNVAEMTEEQKAELEASAREEWEEAVSYYAEYLGGITTESTEEEIAEARLTALSYIEASYGYTEESYISEYVEGSKESQMRQNVQKAVLGEIEVTEDEVTAYFNDLVEEDKETYEGNVPMYEYYTQYMGSDSYYVPEGYRGITHILLEVDADLLSTYADLSAKLEEQQEEETADESTETAEEAVAEGEKETEAPVTQEQVDAAKQAILDSVQAQVDEIMAKYEAGTPFGDLIAEYGTDPGMTQEPNKTNGYAVHAESILWDPAFTAGAMALEKVGDVSEPVLGSYGIHLLHYTRDIPAGAIELTEEIREQLKEELLSEKETTAVSAMVEEWTNTAEIVYTDEGQAILDAAEADTESVETTEATEETLADGN
ncbi:MAG: peptidylprolyl isomerase [Clostridia bacterium]|nr:peptidylprolyl isomerase [Clostridia bacterium]